MEPIPAAHPETAPDDGLTELALLPWAATSGAFSLASVTLQPYSAGLPLHTRVEFAGACYVLRGTLAATVGERTVTVREGEVLFVAPEEPYAYWNPTATPVVLLQLTTLAAAAPGAGSRPAHAPHAAS